MKSEVISKVNNFAGGIRKVSDDVKKKAADMMNSVHDKRSDNSVKSEENFLKSINNNSDKKVRIIENTNLNMDEKKLAMDELNKDKDDMKNIHRENRKERIVIVRDTFVMIVAVTLGLVGIKKRA